ncbi:MAG TPA: DUF485 domain-containing protein [Chthoniobacteraceae bacterium]|jgi:uncharacterized membrane protein (DUF485 family)
MSSPTPGDEFRDLTPVVGSQTDMAPLGRSGQKPEHEKTAAEDGDPYDWAAVAADPAFAELKRAKRRFILPATIFFLVYYMSLPILVGYCPDLMKKEVWGKVNVAYVFALSQFIMTWVLCAMYVRAARRWDIMNAKLLARFPLR